MNPPLLDHLAAKQGHYLGHGTNPEGLPFRAELQLTSIVSGNAIQLLFRAQDQEMAFHEEVTLITQDLLKSTIALYTVSTNTPGMLEHLLSEDGQDELRERRLVFRLGDRDDLRLFRQEITLDLMKDGGIEYRYAWGVPHEALAVRNRAVLKPDAASNAPIGSGMPTQSKTELN